MSAEIEVPSPLGLLTLRPERPTDQAFRFQLFCDSRPGEWDVAQIEPAMRAMLMNHQFHAQTSSYATSFPQARSDIIELEGEPIGRIVVNRPGDHLHLVDQAIVPRLRGRGLGGAIMQALMDEAAEAGQPVRLKVASDNDPSMRLYLRLGFVTIAETPMYLEMEWRPASAD